MKNRRLFLASALTLVPIPAIVRASSLMPISTRGGSVSPRNIETFLSGRLQAPWARAFVAGEGMHFVESGIMAGADLDAAMPVYLDPSTNTWKPIPSADCCPLG